MGTWAKALERRQRLCLAHESAASSWGKERGAVEHESSWSGRISACGQSACRRAEVPSGEMPLCHDTQRSQGHRGEPSTPPRLTSWSCSRFSREVPTAAKVATAAGTVPVALPPSSERAGLDWEPMHGHRAGRKERKGFAGCRASHQGELRVSPASPSTNSLCWTVLARGQSVG